MKITQRFTLVALTLAVLSFAAVGCTTTGTTASSGEATFHKVAGDSHRAKHPNGHNPKKGHSCHYSTADDAFFCSF